MLRKINRKAKKRVFSLLFLFVFLISSQFLIFSSPVSATIQEEDISVEWGNNVYQNLPYWYSGTFYDDADFDFAWTTARIDFEYIPDNSITYTHAITDLDNSETQVPTNSSFSMVNGTHYQNGTLDAVDDDYAIFNSTYGNRTIAEQPADFTIGAGNSIYDGDLEFLDGNYTAFESELLGHYPASFSFKDEVGLTGTDIEFVDNTTSGTPEVIELVAGHKHVLKLTGQQNMFHNSTDSGGHQYGTVEFYIRTTDATVKMVFSLENAATQLLGLWRIMGDKFQEQFTGPWADVGVAATDNTWYYIEFSWEYTAGGWKGLTEGQCNLRIDGGDHIYGISDDNKLINYLDIKNDAGADYYIDAYGEYWDPAYSLGDNLINEPIMSEVEVNINLDSFSNLNELYLVYAYLTNISLICNYSIYNFDDSAYDAIEYDINLAFVNSYFLLNSSYYNATNDLILSFEMMHYSAEFEMRLDRLLIRKPSYLNFSTSVNFNTLTNLLQMNIESYQRSNISQLINMSIWNYDMSLWVNLNGSNYITTFQLLEWINTTFSDYINTNGNVSLMYYGVHITDAFRFELDALNFTLWRKTIIQYQKTLGLLGTWKYQFTLDAGLGTEYIQDWVYFNIIEQSPNFEGISESRYSTQWVLTSTATSGNKLIVYEDQLTSGYWDLSDFSSRYFDKDSPESDNYIMDNFTFLEVYYSGTHFDVGSEDTIPRGIVWDGSYFWIVGANNPEVYKYTSAGVYTGTHFDVGAQDIYPYGISWDGTYFWITGNQNDEVYKYTSAGVYTGTHFDVGAQDNTPSGITCIGTDFWVVGRDNDEVYKYNLAGVYSGDHFDVGTEDNDPYGITWDGTNLWIIAGQYDEVYKYTSAGVYTGTHFDVGTEDIYPSAIAWDGTYFWITGNQNDEVYKYTTKFRIYKNYHITTGEGYAYFQSNQVENIGIISEQFGDNEILSEGDIFTVDLQSTSNNALLKLYSGGVLQQTLNLLIGNTEFVRQEIEVLVSVDVSFDQIKITSELVDTEYFKLYDIKAEHWVFEDEEDQRSMYVNPFGQNDLIANLGNNSLKIYENDILRTDIYMMISYDLTTYVFESTIPETVFVSFYDSNNEYLDFNKFTTYVNYTLYEEDYIDQRLTSREFYVDEDSTIYFNVYDSFEVSIYSASRLAKTFIDITLNVHFLKIKNEALEDASYTLTKGIVSKDGILFPDDIDEFQIASGNYSFNYINYEDDSEHSLNINLVENQLLTINTTYFDVYFSLFNYDGLGLERDLFRFYINGLRKDFGFNTLKRDTNNLKVLDYFNASLFDSNVNLRQYTEYNLFVEVYALIINNNNSFSIKIEIERSDIAITFEQVIEAQFGMPYRFLPNIEYYIKSYHINGTLLEEKTVLLDEQFEIVSFGFYSEEIPVIPDFNAPGIWLMIVLILMGCGSAIALVGYLAYRYRKKSENYRRSYADKVTLEAQTIKKFSQGTRIR